MGAGGHCGGPSPSGCAQPPLGTSARRLGGLRLRGSRVSRAGGSASVSGHARPSRPGTPPGPCLPSRRGQRAPAPGGGGGASSRAAPRGRQRRRAPRAVTATCGRGRSQLAAAGEAADPSARAAGSDGSGEDQREGQRGALLPLVVHGRPLQPPAGEPGPAGAQVRDGRGGARGAVAPAGAGGPPGSPSGWAGRRCFLAGFPLLASENALDSGKTCARALVPHSE